MANTSDIRNGLTINFKNDLFSIVEFQHVKPGKGPAFVRTKLKSIKTGRVLDHTFTAGHKIETVRIERRKYQYLYHDGDSHIFMNTEDFEQIPVEKHLINAPQFLKPEDICDLLFHAEEELLLNCELPSTVDLEVTYTEPGVKGDTATNSLKPATVETEAEVRVPLFINTGDMIKVNTTDGSYMERVKQ